jgi:hypothetical protein
MNLVLVAEEFLHRNDVASALQEPSDISVAFYLRGTQSALQENFISARFPRYIFRLTLPTTVGGPLRSSLAPCVAGQSLTFNPAFYREISIP